VEFKDYQVCKDYLDIQEKREILVKLVPLVPLDLQDQKEMLVQRVHKDYKDQLGDLELMDAMVFLA